METLDVASMLGIDKLARNSLDLMQEVEKGLPFLALDRLVTQIAPQDANFKYRLIPKATWARKKAASVLSPDQSERLARLARLWTLAKEIWVTDEETRDFLFRPHPMLEDKRPIDLVIASETGAEIVRDILGRLQFGSAA